MPSKKKTSANMVRVTQKTRKITKKAPMLQSKNVRKTSNSSPKFAVKRGLHLWMHLAIAGSAVAVLLLLGIIDRTTFSTLGGHAAETMPTTIGIEHDAPLTLSMLVARKLDIGYVSIANRSDHLIHVSVPSSWKRTEVKGAALADVKQDIPVFGFTRWTLPAHAGIKLLSDEVPNALFFDSTSNAPTAIDLKTVDLAEENSTSRVILLQQQTLARLWGSEE